MKKLTPLLIMLVALGLVGSVYAEGSPTTAPAKKSVSLLRGEVVSVDATANTITITDKSGKSEILNVDAKVKIKKEGSSPNLVVKGNCQKLHCKLQI